jgi:hypothetical protein
MPWLSRLRARLFEHVPAPFVIATCAAADYEKVKSLQRSAARRYEPLFLGVERSVDCALGRDHCRWFVVGLT